MFITFSKGYGSSVYESTLRDGPLLSAGGKILYSWKKVVLYRDNQLDNSSYLGLAWALCV